jgi:hypothetical protein
MNLTGFERFIDETILARGRVYFRDGRVVSVEEAEDNHFIAEVEGTEIYEVEVLLDTASNITETSCDCPYDMGPYCKHQVAVFFSLRNMLGVPKKRAGPEVSKNTESTPSGKAAARQKSKKPDLRQILSERPKEELIALLMDIADKNRDLRTHLEYHFQSDNQEDELQKSVKLIRSYIKTNSDRHGYVDYRSAGDAVRGAELVLEKACSVDEEGNCLLALDLVLCVMQEMADLLGKADDSDGIISGEIYQCFEIIGRICEDLRLADTDKVFSRLLREASSKRFGDYTDWMLDFLNICANLTDTKTMRNKLEEQLSLIAGRKTDDSWSSSYLNERIDMIRYGLAQRFDGSDAAQGFLTDHLKHPEFRNMAIDNAMKNKDYGTVIKLALDGEKSDTGLPGLVNKWKAYRYHACKLSGMLDEQRQIAMEFILGGSYDYYMELKNTYAPEEWHPIYLEILSKLASNRYPYEIYTRIMVEEGEKQKLLEYIHKQPHLIERFYIDLIPEYAEDVYNLFQQYIEYSAAGASDRSGYRRVCGTVRLLKKAGGKDRAAEIKKKLTAMYIRKPAFLDELSKV